MSIKTVEEQQKIWDGIDASNFDSFYYKIHLFANMETASRAGCTGETLWVKGKVYDEKENKHLGTIANNPVTTDEFKYGDEVQFTTDQILDINAVNRNEV